MMVNPERGPVVMRTRSWVKGTVERGSGDVIVFSWMQRLVSAGMIGALWAPPGTLIGIAVTV
jgi:hypothetical protein